MRAHAAQPISKGARKNNDPPCTDKTGLAKSRFVGFRLDEHLQGDKTSLLNPKHDLFFILRKRTHLI